MQSLIHRINDTATTAEISDHRTAKNIGTEILDEMMDLASNYRLAYCGRSPEISEIVSNNEQMLRLRPAGHQF